MDKEGGRFVTLQGTHLVLPFFGMVVANGWNAPPNEVALIEIGAGLISRECSTNAT